MAMYRHYPAPRLAGASIYEFFLSMGNHRRIHALVCRGYVDDRQGGDHLRGRRDLPWFAAGRGQTG